MKSHDVPGKFPHDWASVRSWLISYLRLFLEYSEMPANKDSWRWLEEGWRNLSQLYSRGMRKLPDDHAAAIVDHITTSFGEPAATRSALWGMFNDSVLAAKELLALLEEDLPPEAISKEVRRICDRI